MAFPVLASYEIGHTLANPVVSVTCNRPTGLTAGDLIILAAITRAAPGPVAPILTINPSGFNSLASRLNTVDVYAQAWTRIADGSEPASFQIDTDLATTQSMCMIAARITGYATPVPHQSGSGDNATVSDTTVEHANMTTTDADCLILRITAFTAPGAGVNSCTVPAGYTERLDDHSTNVASIRRGISLSEKNLAVAGATGVEVTTLAVSRLWAEFSLAISAVAHNNPSFFQHLLYNSGVH
jgi:hypothetical protein